MLLIIPITIIGVVVYSYLIDRIGEKDFKSNTQLMQQLEKTIDTKFMEISEIATEISTNNLMSIEKFRDPYYHFTMRGLLYFNFSHSFLGDLLLYDREEQRIYSSQSAYPLDTFLQRYSYRDWPQEDIARTLDTLRYPALRPAEPVNNTSYITVLRPIPISYLRPTGVAIFLLKEQFFKEMLSSLLYHKDMGAVILDQEGREITGSYAESQDELADLYEHVRSLESSADTYRSEISGESMFITYARSDMTGFTYIVYTPAFVLLNDVSISRNFTMLVLALCFLLGIIIIYFSMYLNYAPLSRIEKKIDKSWTGDAAEGNSFHKIERALSRADIIDQQLQSHMPQIRQSLLFGLLQGHITDRNEFNRRGQSLGLNFSGDCFYIVIIQTEPPSYDQINRDEGYAAIEKLGAQIFEVGTDIGLTLIVCDDGLSFGLADEWERLRKTISDNANQEVTIGIGNSYKEFASLMQSYIEASTAIQHKFIYGSENVIYFNKLELNLPRNDWKWRDLLQTFMVHLERDSEEQATEIMQLLLAEIRQKSISLFQAKSICIEIINIILKYLREREVQVDTKDAISMPDVISYANFNSIENLLVVTEEVCSMACKALTKQSHAKDNDSSIVRIREFIHQHCLDYNFSLQWMSDDLGLSVSYVSRLFKMVDGETIMEHVNGLRMEKAKELLSTTQLPVKEIVEIIGYKDDSSFIRKFRKTFQLTPLEYRQHFMERKNSDDT